MLRSNSALEVITNPTNFNSSSGTGGIDCFDRWKKEKIDTSIRQ